MRGLLRGTIALAVLVLMGVLIGTLATLPVLAQYSSKVYLPPGGEQFVVDSGGELLVKSGGSLTVNSGATETHANSVTFSGAASFTGAITQTLAAASAFLVDGATTAHTGTAGALDVNSATITADVSALDVLQTTNNGTTAATDVFLANLTMTQNDADADAFGVKLTASATANAGAGSYEYGYFYDCAENTAGACLDGILITSSGIDAGLTTGVDVSAANLTNALEVGSNLILGDNSDSMSIGATDNTLTVTASTTATAVFQGADAASPANTLLDTTGAGTITIGSADVTNIIASVDNDVSIQNGATGNVVLDFRDYADSTDDDMAHAILTTNCTDAGTGAEDCDFTIGVVEAGAAAVTRLNLDADGGITLGDSTNGAVTTISTGVTMRNAATGNVTLDFRDYADTTDDDMAHTLLTTNCTDAGTGAEDCDFTVGIVEAGDAAETRLNFDADGDITLGSANAAGITLNSTGVTNRNAATGSVTLDFRDYADTTDDDMAHVVETVNCTDTGTGAEDCDYTLGVVEAGAAADTRLNLDADGGITLGSANNNSFTFTADGTGDTEFTIPASGISAGEIVDIARNINVPLLSFIDCQTDAGTRLVFVSGVDALADIVNSATDGTGFVIRFDDTAATEDQNSEICSQFTVPPDYASGGAFVIRALKDAHAGATEVLNAAVSVNGAQLQAAGTTTTSAAASTSYTVTPTIAALVAGDSVSFYVSITSGTTIDDTVDVAAVAFQYTATE